MARSGDVNLNIGARNSAGPVLEQVKQQLRGLDQAAGIAGKGLAGLGGFIGAGAVVAGIQQITGAIVDMAAGAARLETLRNSFDSLAGGVGMASADMLEALRGASRGMIADQDLLLAANKALLLGVADSTEELTGLMDIARVRGAAMGLSMTQAFDNIVTGLGRGSALILDNLGITVDLDRVNREYAEGLNKTAAALTVTEQKQALINAVMAQSADMVNGATDSLSANAVAIGSMGAAWQNLKDQLGTLVSPAVATAMQGLADALNAVNTAIATAPADKRADENAARIADIKAQIAALDELSKKEIVAAETAQAQPPRDVGLEIIQQQIAAEQQRYQAVESIAGREAAAIEQATGARQAYQQTLAATGSEAAAMAAQLRVELAALEMNTGATNDNLDAQQARIRAVQDATAADQAHVLAQGEADHAIGATTQALLDQIAKLNTVGGALDAYSSKLRGMAAQLAGVIGTGSALAMLKAEESQIKKNTAAYEAMNWPASQIALVVETTADQTAAAWQETIDAPAKAAAEAEKAAKTASSAYEKMMSEAESAYNSFVGKVQGILQSSLSLDVGDDWKKALPHADAANENARRLAAIAMEGLKDQSWLDEFKSQVPDVFALVASASDPKAMAAALLTDFQDGLRPDLLDKEKAKEMVRIALTGESNMAALAQEIAAELSAELGVSLQQTQAAAFGALGIKSPEGATGVSEGAAQELINEKTLQGMAKAGIEAAATWGTAFLDRVGQSVPGQLIEMLTTLITPQVQAKIAAAQTQTGAQ